VIGPIASEMPEKIAAYITVGRNARLAEISVCNFIGSRVNHTTLLLATIPIVAAFQGRGNVEGVINPLFYIMVALTIPATYSLATRRPNKWHGLVFTVCYGLFLWAAFHFNIQIGHG
jgi:Ca2+/Na+ antiporter